LLEEAVVSGAAQPERVLATTFTTRAAGELHRRVAERLIGCGRVDLARRLSGARIGTVNAVASQLASDFALELGLSPTLRVLDAKDARILQARTLSAIVTEAELDALQDLRTRLVAFDWTDAVASAIDSARANAVGTEGLLASIAQSQSSLVSILDLPQVAQDLDRDLAHALERFLVNVPVAADQTQATARAIVLARESHHDLSRGRLSWARWQALAELSPGAQSREHALPVRAAAGGLLAHPKLREDLEQAVDLVLGLAARTLSAYEAAKKADGVVDFVDQERLALQLLTSASIAEAVDDRVDLDLVLIDEFQDTSPLQLALFGQLAARAHRSIWVADPKQAIYAFRGTDPGLVETCVGALPGPVEVLGKSWRSRPGLVRLTTAIFTPPFERQGLPAERVRMDPANPTEPPGLGPFIERWRLPSDDRAGDVIALGAIAGKFLADASVRIRGEGNATRPAKPGDVAILCRTNAACRAVADVLVARGIPAIADRPGLTGTPEARLLNAGLRIWRDTDDELALAELGRLLDTDPTGASWLDRLLAQGPQSFASCPEVAALLTERMRRPSAGVVEAVDAVIEALDAPGRCRAWGHSAQRLANLEAMRRLAVAFESDGRAPPTIAGFLAHLDSLSLAGEDWRGEPEGRSAITVCTWHASKGLEWPVVVLFELDSMKTGVPFDIQVDSSRAPTLMNPLRDRRIRYWPSPFLPQQSLGPFFDRIAATPEGRRATEQAAREELRLLYVAWTRARDRLVLAARSDKLSEGSLSLLAAKGRPLVVEPLLRTVTWAGQKIDVVIREGSLKVPASAPPEPGEGFPRKGPVANPPAFARPSDLLGRGRVVRVSRLGPAITPIGKPAADLLGTALHGFFAGDDHLRTEAERASALESWLTSSGIAGAVNCKQVLDAANALRTELLRRFPDGIVSTEVPISRRMQSGTVLRGAVDLVAASSVGLAVIDHKVFIGSPEACVELARDAYGQVASYGETLAEATGLPIAAFMIHLPLSGLLVELHQESPPSAVPGALD
jgi:ATP-dependent helicase/nuclease subunit A